MGRKEGSQDVLKEITMIKMSNLEIKYDRPGQCTALQESNQETLIMGCPFTGNGEGFSPANMVAAGLGGCTLMSIGTAAQEKNIDLSGIHAEIEIYMNDALEIRIGEINLKLHLPEELSDAERQHVEHAAGMCAIKASLHPDIRMNTQFEYRKM